MKDLVKAHLPPHTPRPRRWTRTISRADLKRALWWVGILLLKRSLCLSILWKGSQAIFQSVIRSVSQTPGAAPCIPPDITPQAQGDVLDCSGWCRWKNSVESTTALGLVNTLAGIEIDQNFFKSCFFRPKTGWFGQNWVIRPKLADSAVVLVLIPSSAIL